MYHIQHLQLFLWVIKPNQAEGLCCTLILLAQVCVGVFETQDVWECVWNWSFCRTSSCKVCWRYTMPFFFFNPTFLPYLFWRAAVNISLLRAFQTTCLAIHAWCLTYSTCFSLSFSQYIVHTSSVKKATSMTHSLAYFVILSSDVLRCCFACNALDGLRSV